MVKPKIPLKDMLNMINKIRNNQHGLTLIELLATLLISSVIAIFAISILINGLNQYKTISAENVLRDEADLILVQLYRNLYTTKLSEIASLKQESLLSNGLYRDSYLTFKTSNLKTGFINDKLILKNNEYILQSKNIRLNTATNKSSITESSVGVYKIKLVLYLVDKKKTMEFVTEVSVIKDQEV